MADMKPLVINGGQLQRLQSGDNLDTTGLFAAGTNLGSISGLAGSGLTVHNGTAFTTVSLTAPATGMTITNASGVGGSPTFAFTAELDQLISMTTGIVAKTGTGTLAARTIQGTTNQLAVTNGTGVSGNPTVYIVDNPVLPGTQAVTVPTGNTAARGTGANGMMRYNSETNLFEFHQGGTWIQYGTSSASGTVTSVNVALPTNVFSASSGAITTSGTITFTLNTQVANTVFAGPTTGGDATPTFRALVANDIPSLDWSKITGEPTTLAGYGITDAVVNTTQVIAGTGLSGGGALSGNVTISMPNVGTAVTGQFVKITTDAQGRVSATSAVGSSDITTALGYPPVNKAGDTMASAANLTFAGGGTVTGLPLTASAASDAASMAYVDNMVASGTTWRDPVVAPNLVGFSATEPATPDVRDQWIATASGTWGTQAVVSGTIVEYRPDTLDWYSIGELTIGDRFTVAYDPVNTVLDSSIFNIGIRSMDLIEYVGGTFTTAGAWTLPHHDTNQALMYDAVLTGAYVTNLLSATTYTATIKLNGVGTTDNISYQPVADNPDWTTLLAAIQADLDTAFGTNRVIAELVAGHVHITGQVAGDAILIIDGAVDALFADANALIAIRGSVLPGTTVLVSNILSNDNGRTGLFSGGDDGSHSWVEIGGPTAINAGVGLVFDGNILNVNLGAGLTETPTDEVGIDLYAPLTEALQLVSPLDGITSSTDSDAQLRLIVDGTTIVQTSGLSVGVITKENVSSDLAGGGLVKAAAIDAMSVNVDNSTLEINTDQVRVKAAGITESHLATSVAGAGLAGGGGTALSVNVDNSSIEINTDTLRIKTAGVTNAMLANSTHTFAGTSGSSTNVALGGTLTIAAGTGITTTGSANTVTVALNAALDDLSDVTITTAAAGHVIYRNAGNTAWVNAAPGATSGVQAYDATLAALAGLNTTAGVVVQTGTDTFTKRTVTGTAGRVTVADGDGVAGNPTIDLASGIVTAGTYSSVTVDTYGRVTAGSSIESTTQVSLTNTSGGTMTIGQPVYVETNGNVDLADASTSPHCKVIGLVASTTISDTTAGNIAVAGILTATAGQWDTAVAESIPTGLTGGTTYYLSESTGLLTSTAPTTTGAYVAPVGIALSATQMKIHIEPTVKL